MTKVFNRLNLDIRIQVNLQFIYLKSYRV